VQQITLITELVAVAAVPALLVAMEIQPTVVLGAMERPHLYLALLKLTPVEAGVAAGL
jgi:Na+/citrate or Na+/malate symporter